MAKEKDYSGYEPTFENEWRRLYKRWADWREQKDAGRVRFMSSPEGIASAVGASGDSLKKLTRYALIAISIGWTELATAIMNYAKKKRVDQDVMEAMKHFMGDMAFLQRAAEMTYKYSKTPKTEDFRPSEEDAEMQEDIEKHDSLNAKLFDGDKLKEEVRGKLLEIVDRFLETLDADGVDILIDDVVLTGSNASYNYTDDSDIDLHIVADVSSEDNPEIVKLLYNAYRVMFREKYAIDIFGLPVEVYVETEGTPSASKGRYSVLRDEWVIKPAVDEVPDVDQGKIDELVAPWKEKCEKVIQSVDPATSVDEKPIDDLISELYELRKKGLQDGGEYSEDNLVFKEVRNSGLLSELKKLRDAVISNKLSLKDEPRE